MPEEGRASRIAEGGRTNGPGAGSAAKHPFLSFKCTFFSVPDRAFSYICKKATNLNTTIMSRKRQIFRGGDFYEAPTLELHAFSVEQGFANSLTNDYLEIKGDDYDSGPGLDGYNDLDF